MAGARVVVVGSINVDMVVAAERLPARGETVAGGTLTRSGGGKGANQAVAAARAGGDVALVGAVGDDDLGAGALAELAAEGIDVSAVARLGDGPTGVALIVVDAAGDNQIAVASGANHALDPDAVRAAVARSGARRGPHRLRAPGRGRPRGGRGGDRGAGPADRQPRARPRAPRRPRGPPPDPDAQRARGDRADRRARPGRRGARAGRTSRTRRSP